MSAHFQKRRPERTHNQDERAGDTRILTDTPVRNVIAAQQEQRKYKAAAKWKLPMSPHSNVDTDALESKSESVVMVNDFVLVEFATKKPVR